MPYEEITQKQYQEMSSKIKRIELQEDVKHQPQIEKYCDGDSCNFKKD